MRSEKRGRRRPNTDADTPRSIEELAASGPSELSVELIVIDGEQFALFEWAGPAPDATLTEAERDVLARLVAGASNAEIAKMRRSSERTVANQVAALLRKLGVSSRFELIGRFGSADRPPMRGRSR